jgi:hypothetical protein
MGEGLIKFQASCFVLDRLVMRCHMSALKDYVRIPSTAACALLPRHR